MSSRVHKVLVVVTSHDRLGDSGMPTGFWLEELATPYYALIDAGIDVDIASVKGGRAPVDPKSAQEEWKTESATRFEGDATAVRRLANTLKASEVKADEYDAVYLAGGHGTMWDFPTDPSLANLLQGFIRAGKLIASVCHGVAALIPLKDAQGRPLVAGKALTSFTDTEERAVQLDAIVPFLLESRLRELGARFESGPDWGPKVVRDGNLITGQNPASAAPTSQALIDAMAEKKRPGRRAA